MCRARGGGGGGARVLHDGRRGVQGGAIATNRPATGGAREQHLTVLPFCCALLAALMMFAAQVCTWEAASREQWVSADATCVEAAVVSAIEEAAGGCLAAMCAVGEVRGGACWLGCLGELGEGAVAAGVVAVAAAFEGSCQLV